MDERVFRFKRGRPIPEWDLKHRLPLKGAVGPELRDSATTFRINSIYMDVSDQPHISRQWLSGGVLTALLGLVMCIYAAISLVFISPSRVWEGIDTFAVAMVLSFALFFGFISVWLGKNEFFSLTRRPVRFNRNVKKIYAVRSCRHLDGHMVGDYYWEIPWDDSAIFCVHKGPAKFDLDEHYHIRCYQLDEQGNVDRAFAIGREWTGTDGLRDLLAQWNFWCEYMNHGPSNLPPPLLYLSEYEDLHETFSYCLYEIGFGLNGLLRTMFMPFIVLLTSHRLMSLSTCRMPVWPDEVLDVSRVPLEDIYDQPRGDTPIGWAATFRARREGSYPREPHRLMENWTGELDPMKNAERWERNEAPSLVPKRPKKSSNAI